MTTFSKAPGRRGRWAWRCAIFAGAAALGAVSGRERTPPSFAGGLHSSLRTGGLRLRAVGDELQAGVEDALGGVQKKVTDVLDTPNRLQKQAKATVDKTLESFQKDDGRVLDPEAPSGVVGAITVSLAILPYIPVSIYSTYLLATTGKGIPAGPNGLFGLAEGLSTLVIFCVVLWSTVSFLTRGARGLPAGPFNILGATQSLSFLSALFLLLTAFIKGNNAASPLSGFKGVKMPDMPQISLPDTSKLSLPKAPDMPKVDAPTFNLPKVDLPKVDLPKTPDLSGLSKDSSSFIGNLQKGINDKVEKAKDAVESAVEKAGDKVEDFTEKVAPPAPKPAEPPAPKPEAKAAPAPPKPKAPEPAPAKPKSTESKVDIEDLF